MSHRRTALAAATAAMLLGGAGSAFAAATPITTNITSPADNSRPVYNRDDPATNTITITGTSSGIADGGTVDIRCYYIQYYGGQDYNTVKTGVAVNGNAFSYTGPDLSDITGDDYGCRLRAVPSSNSSDDLSRYSGPRMYAIEYDPTQINYPIHGGGGPVDSGYRVYVNGWIGNAYVESAGEQGLTLEPTSSDRGDEPAESTDGGGYGWEAGGEISGSDYDNLRASALVDGKNAFVGAGVPRKDYDQGGAEAVTYPTGFTAPTNGLQVGTNGDVKITETSVLWICNDENVWPPTDLSCASVSDSGVHLNRTWMIPFGGGRVTQTDTLTSTGGAHQVFIQYYNNADHYEYPSWNLPGDASGQWGMVSEGTPLIKPATPGSIVARDNEYPDDQYDTPNTGLTWLTQPAKIWFSDNGEDVQSEYDVSVPAGGGNSVTQVFTARNLSAKALAAANAVEDELGVPVVDVVAPVNGTATNVPNTTVVAKVRDNKGVKGVTINGVAVSPTADGTVTLSLPLKEGANPITIVATDGAGQNGSASTTVTYVKPPASALDAQGRKDVLATLCKVPTIKRGATLSSAKSAITKANCKAKTRTIKSRAVKKGRVISVSPSANLLLVPQATVTITQSGGPPKAKKKATAKRR